MVEGDNKARAVYCQRNNCEAGVKKFDGWGTPDGNCTFDGEGERKLDGSRRLSRENNPNRARRLNSSSR